MNIFFNRPKAREYLMKNGIVYTLRPAERKNGTYRLCYGNYFKSIKLGQGEVEFIKKIEDDKELEDYVARSGFDTCEEWIKEANGARYLHLVLNKRR